MTTIRRMILGSVAVALLASVAATPAEAGRHHRAKSACAPVCEPVCEPVCAPAPVCEPVCAPAPVCEPVCAPAPVCPPPVKVTWCVVDPVTCCSYQVEACVPACCAGVQPCLVDCQKGFLHRKVLTYKFPGCDHCVDVVVTKHGRTIVRG